MHRPVFLHSAFGLVFTVTSSMKPLCRNNPVFACAFEFLLYAVLTAFMLHATWLTWPDAFIDFSRELYLPWRVSQGDVLYRDLAYYFGPVSVYTNAALFALNFVFWIVTLLALRAILRLSNLSSRLHCLAPDRSIPVRHRLCPIPHGLHQSKLLHRLDLSRSTPSGEIIPYILMARKRNSISGNRGKESLFLVSGKMDEHGSLPENLLPTEKMGLNALGYPFVPCLGNACFGNAKTGVAILSNNHQPTN